MDEIIKFIESNMGTEAYNLARFSTLPDNPMKIDVANINPYLIRWATKDLEIFSNIEKNRLKYTIPIVGDAILRKDGRTTFIGHIYPDGHFQDTPSGSFFIRDYGASYSGGFTGGVLNIKNLTPHETMTPLFCWIFSQNITGGGRGVYHTIKVRTWKEL